MHIDKDRLLEALRSNGRASQIRQVEQNLPNRIDTDEHSDLLRALGVTSGDLGALGEVAAQAPETGGFGGFGGPGARISRLGG
jgi:hypothetical protein